MIVPPICFQYSLSASCSSKIGEFAWHVDNSNAVEIGGNGVMMSQGRDVFVGLAEEPTWIRYPAEGDRLVETGRVSFGRRHCQACHASCGNVV